jgi:hypothetical protein
VCGDYESIHPVAADCPPWKPDLASVVLVLVLVFEAVQPKAALVASRKAVEGRKTRRGMR